MAEYSDFLYYKDKQISHPNTGSETQHAPIHITLPPLKRPQSPPSATSPPFSFQSTNFYAQHIHELASSPPSKTHLGPYNIELQPVVAYTKEPVVKSDPQEALKRCQNCGQYYKVKDNVADKSGSAPCRYHPGKYQAPITSQHMGAFPMWTCCKNDEHALGCRVQLHVEDVEATQTLRSYDELRRALGHVTDAQSGQEEALIDFTGLGAVPGTTRTIRHEATQTPTAAKPSSVAASSGKSRAPVRVSSTQLVGTALIHYVKTSDTLYGLALKYDVTVADIKAANKMTSDNIFAYSQLIIPRATEEVEVAEEVSQEDVACRQAQMLNKFKRTQRVTAEEALYYLDICEWKYDEAVKEREEDVKFDTVMGARVPRSELVK